MTGTAPQRVRDIDARTIPLSAEVGALIARCGLPVPDPREAGALVLLGLHESDRLVGVVGVERHGTMGLLRSLAVDEAGRGRGRGRALVARAEAWAARQGIEALYLLATGAGEFFARLGYAAVPRTEAPEEIAATEQFSSLCPASATLMRKMLDGGRGAPGGAAQAAKGAR